MGTVPRPLLGALLAVVAFFAAWTLVLKPHASAPDANGVSVVHAYNSAISKLHAAQAGKSGAGAATSNPGGQTVHHGAPASPTTATKSHAVVPAHGNAVPVVHPASRPLGPDGHHAALRGHHAAAPAASAAKPAPAAPSSPKPAAHRPVLPAALSANVLAEQQVAKLDSALRAGQVIALLFYNPSAADDLAVRQALGSLPSRSGLTKLAVPISELSRFSAVTNEVPVTASPTVVVIDRRHQATTLVGFVDPLELEQLIDNAFAAR